jgi:L-ribulokinase
MPRYALGLDYGTESARALLVDVADGREAATAVMEYPDGVIDKTLPGTAVGLGPEWALQNPDDYLAVLERTVPQALSEAGAAPEHVVGIGVDFTSCTVLPTTVQGTPLCQDPRWRDQPHAWTKLWKHHAAQPQAEAINRIAAERGERFLARYGGKTSSEWLLAKAWQTCTEAPEVYQAAAHLVEAGDWLVWQLTGRLCRSACQAGYKGLWSAEEGWPSADFCRALDPRLAQIAVEKLPGEVLPIGTRAGGLLPAWASRLGLRPGTPVGVAIIDAHAAVPAATITGPGAMLMILGTSGCHLMLGREERVFPGIAGVVKDGILPGFYGYEAGQPATGDMLNWFTRHACPAEIAAEAEARGISRHALLVERAAGLRAGQSGLLALDWWNGNRSVLMDADLSGLILGLALDTRPEEIYRALIEAGAYGTRAILENFERNGMSIEALYACGGLAERNELLVQVYADVTRRPIRLVRSGLACALGAAILGAVAAGSEGGGHDDLASAAQRMGGVKERVYTPQERESAVYDRLYQEFFRLHDLFGRGGDDVMRRLRAWRGQ